MVNKLLGHGVGKTSHKKTKIKAPHSLHRKLKTLVKAQIQIMCSINWFWNTKRLKWLSYLRTTNAKLNVKKLKKKSCPVVKHTICVIWVLMSVKVVFSKIFCLFDGLQNPQNGSFIWLWIDMYRQIQILNWQWNIGRKSFLWRYE